MSAIRLGLIGHPLGHSMSPYIHERIMEASGISGRYELFDIDPKEIDRYAPILMRELHGFNVTIPYKEKIIKYLDGLDPRAGRLRAVNTVFEKRGYNTDRDGFSACAVDMSNKNVLILGAGGVARMLAFEAADAGANIDILAVLRDQAETLARDLGPFAKAVRIADSEEDAARRNPDVVLNATPLDVSKCAAVPEFRCSDRDTVAFDTVYNPPATRFALAAQSRRQATADLMLFIALPRKSGTMPNFREPVASDPKDLPKEILKNLVKIIVTGLRVPVNRRSGGRSRSVSALPLLISMRKLARMRLFDRGNFREGRRKRCKIETEAIGSTKRPGSLLIATGGGPSFKMRTG